ncbi:hypothetical protein ACJ72_03908 [Emergomyces africanus]|uniref:Uncharacterized protein n=1 Tax=Emergomyces africanus TaxID=1955775 RepID=A0A1B7NYA3_9EURO|nr:hypothetical protein ACJ72_03908 [Emergomyces africanus]
MRTAKEPDTSIQRKSQDLMESEWEVLFKPGPRPTEVAGTWKGCPRPGGMGSLDSGSWRVNRAEPSLTASGEESAHPGARKVSQEEEMLKMRGEVSGASVPDE